VFSKSAGMFEEPFPTLTMARILAEQGHFKRSLAIYAGLLRSGPGDRELSAEVKEVRARSRARRSQAH
jgi:cytochrome c-type biogenesis protein CcmH/NrfG